MTKHISVLLREAIEGLHLTSGDTVIDATLGGGGYTRALWDHVGPSGRVIACDRDAGAIARFRAAEPVLAQKTILVHGNFTELPHIVAQYGITMVNGIVADLGISSDQLDDPERGISFRYDGPLDMRMDQSTGITAAEWIATAEEQTIATALRVYGDERYAHVIARAIVQTRAVTPITTTQQLVACIVHALPRIRSDAIHPATRTFQALRIVINHEDRDVAVFLPAAIDLLAPGGHLAIVSFHSGEDRVVKQFLRAQARGCVCPPTFPLCQCGRVPHVRLATSRAIRPSEEEIAANPRARSARLRVAQKCALQ